MRSQAAFLVGRLPLTAVREAPSVVPAAPSETPPCVLEENRFLRGENGRFLSSTGGGPGRPKGMKNAESSLLRAAPKLARAYIKKACSGDPTLLKDARSWIMPVDGEYGNSPERMIVFIGEAGFIPRAVTSIESLHPRPATSETSVIDRPAKTEPLAETVVTESTLVGGA